MLIVCLTVVLSIVYFNVGYYKPKRFLFNKLINNKHVLNIIFIETNQTRQSIDYKEMCSIESAALTNPNANVILFSLNANLSQNLLKHYKNIYFYKNKIEDLFQSTPFYNWWLNKSEIITTSPYVSAHLADALRLSLLYKHGGIYSDLGEIQ